MKVPFVDLSAEHTELRPRLDAAIGEVLDSNWFIGGPQVAGFESELATATGAADAVGVSSGTDALLATLMALGLGPGDEVVTTPFTFFATAAVVARVGATPVFVDIDPATFNLDFAQALAAIGAKTRLLLPVNLFGRPADLGVVPDGVDLVEDAAQSIGACEVRGLASTLSFFPTKNLGALGDGGAVLTDSAEFADRLRIVRAQGARPKYFHSLLGGNFRLDAVQAAVLRVKLTELPRRTASRRASAGRYRELFGAAEVPPELTVPSDVDAHIYNQFVIRAPRRDALRQFLSTAEIGTEIYYPRPLHLQQAFADLGYREGSLPAAEAACAEVLALPIGPGLTAEQQSFIVDQVVAFYRS
jgi:dTDP-4-amino-4,6-dideoxygalactose transaminase